MIFTKTSKALFTAVQVETLLSCVFGTVTEKFDSCIDKIVDKFEARLEKLYGDLSTANCRIDKLEQELRVRDQAASPWSVEATSAAEPPAAQSDQSTVSSAKQPPVTTKVGRRPAGDSVKAIEPPLSCFVGRLDPKTTADDLKRYLEEVGIKDADCWKIQAKDGRVFKTAAFRVSCRDEFRDLFNDDSTWPEGAEVRDWVYRRRVPAV